MTCFFHERKVLYNVIYDTYIHMSYLCIYVYHIGEKDLCVIENHHEGNQRAF